MYKILFWKSWPTVYQRIGIFVALAFSVSLAFLFISFVRGPETTYGWQQLQELQQQQVPVHTFGSGGFEFTLSAVNYILFERWTTAPLHLNLFALDAYGILFTLGMIFLFSILTVLPRFWFFAGAGVAMFMISTFQLEALGISGLPGKAPTIVFLALFLGITVYYQYIRAAASFLQRVSTFAIAALLAGLIIAQFSQELQPLRYFAINTMPAAIVMLLVFIILVAHEIMAGFVSLVGQGTRNSKSVQHYLIISGIYLINLWIAYWNKIGWIDWGLNIHPVVLLAVSGILAIWGIRQRQPLYEQIISADPFGVYFMLALGTIAFALVGYFFATSTDISLLSMSDLILYSQIGYGMMFLMYMASNFLGMLAANFPVYKVMYKPTVMPYFSNRMAGLIFTLAFLFYNSWMVPVNHFISGYYTSLGDLYAQGDQKILAAGYYKRAYVYAPYNQHSSTALAEWEAARENHIKQRQYLDDANSYLPTEFTSINSANTYSSNKLEEILVLQEDLSKLRSGGVIQNNLGLAYARLGVVDSAYRYFSRARKNNLTESSADMNLLGLLAEHNVAINPDSVYRQLESTQPRVASNAYAIANRRSIEIDIPIVLPRDSVLDLFSAALIGNYITNHLTRIDTSLLSSCIALGYDSRNKSYDETVLVPAAMASYASGQVNRAFEILQRLASVASNPGVHNTTMGLWALEQGKPDVASPYFQFALSQKSGQAALANAVTSAETGELDKSIIAWDTLGITKDSAAHALAESMKRVLGAPPFWFKDLTDNEKYQYVRYRLAINDSVQFNRLAPQIIDENLRAKAILDHARKLFSMDELKKATTTYNMLPGLHISDQGLFDDIRYFEFHLLAAQARWTTLGEQIKKDDAFGPYRETYRVYFEALEQAAAGDSAHAEFNFQWIARNNYLFDEGVVSAANFLRLRGHPDKEIYSILSEALQVNPRSVKILKAYIVCAVHRGFDTYAASALQRLQSLIAPPAFREFVSKNQLSDLLLQ